ncbi:hypothetical protein [Alkalihalobacillus trypoxylicola]|uniref:Uncharacterized protein n=1 Tax=Alkalihalobacillus trypoxylicola TaxID=519424 RepID=A0A162D575_9BACI|nr:hypothetical protein [Alkalihalobacillus trypoxylicola]KYG28146.1 hypothetical protein AZF04_09590 [Alkalihalobacillus trypoxylicola]
MVTKSTILHFDGSRSTFEISNFSGGIDLKVVQLDSVEKPVSEVEFMLEDEEAEELIKVLQSFLENEK